MTPRRHQAAAALLLVLVSLVPFIGRCVISSDGAEVVSETLGFLVLGEPSFGRLPSVDEAAGVPGTHSRYGLVPSLVPLPFLAPAWPFRTVLGAPALDALAALTWTAGAALCAWAFGALVRALDPSASPFWAPAFLAGTYLLPYAADSYMEPFAGAALAGAAAMLISKGSSRAWAAALLWGAACLLKPILWLTAPVLLLAAALTGERRLAPLLKMLGAFAGVLAIQAAAALSRGTGWSSGYGDLALQFSHPIFHGLYGLLVSPGRGVLLYAPVLVVAAVGARRLSVPARVLLFGAPLVHLLVIARWAWWDGGSAWGPRLLLPVVPLAAAAAALAPRGLFLAALALGFIVNLPGTVVSAGSWIAYAEALRPPAGAAWPEGGISRVSDVPALSPLKGHSVLVLRNVFGRDVKPGLPPGAGERAPLPDAAESVSPWILRRALGLPPIRPMIPRLLVRSAAGFAARGDAARAGTLAREALRLSPEDPDARRLAAMTGAPSRP